MEIKEKNNKIHLFENISKPKKAFLIILNIFFALIILFAIDFVSGRKLGFINLTQSIVYGHYYSSHSVIPVGKDGTFRDERDGHVYKWVEIGEQIWMTENLSCETNKGCWTYDNNYENLKKLGYLYNWAAAQNVCPVGWHIPSDIEWIQLFNYLGGDRVAGGKLKKTGTNFWKSPNLGASNSSRFSALPAGVNAIDFFSGINVFSNIGEYTWYWSCTEYNKVSMLVVVLSYDNEGVGHSFAYGKEKGISVRCLKNSFH